MSYTSTQQYAESQRGREVDITMSSQYNNGTWGDLTGMQILDFLDDLANTTGGPIPIVMLPPWIPTANGGNWADAGAGTYDADYQAIGARISLVRGNKPTVLRFAWENNGDWYDWGIVNISAGSSAAKAAIFIAGWQRAVQQIRIGAGANASAIIFDYCISNLDDKSGTNTLDPLAVCYPGDLYVDVIGQDIYDRDNVTTSDTVPGWHTEMQTAYDFAVAHNKAYSVDEWGLNHSTGGSFTRGNDNPHFINAMVYWFNQHLDSLGWENYFQDDDTGNVNSSLWSPDVNNNPNSRSAMALLMV